MRSDIIPILATILALIFGLIVFSIVPNLAWLLLIATLCGIFVWIVMGKVYSSGSVIRFVLWFRGRTVAGLTGDMDLKDINSLEKGYFILEEEEEKVIEEELSRRPRFLSHVRESLVRPWIPILFLISLAINLLKFADFIPAITQITQEEAVQLIINVNIIIFFVSPIILGLIMPGLFILRDYSLYYFQREKGNVEVEKASGFGQKLLEGFVGGSAILGFMKFFIELATAPNPELAGQIALILLIAIGSASHSIVWTLFFYLPFHRRYVHQLNNKIARMGVPRAVVEIKPIKRV
ncbi:MAG: hypothetical protein KAI34_01440 [Candidatus Lokiarchaeota archaeon]|nr:hypothetical protein [Candidatus Lokiarchaeota archaeon]